MSALAECTWPKERLAEALALLADRAGFEPRAHVELPSPPGTTEPGAIEAWLERTAAHLAIEVEALRAPYRDAAAKISAAAPAILELGTPGSSSEFLLILSAAARGVTVLRSDGARVRLALETVREAWCRELESELDEPLEGLLDELALGGKARAAARSGILAELLAEEELEGGWSVTLPPGRDFRLQAKRAGLGRRLLLFTGAHTLLYGTWILGWYVIGRAALAGRIEAAWIAAWVLLLLTLIPLRLLETLAQGALEIGASTLLKRRLLQGALRLEPDEVRHLGAGRFLSRVIESEEVESNALSAGFLGVAAAIELPVGFWILSRGAGGWIHAAALVLWTLFALWIAWRYHLENRAWTDSRLAATHDLVERMVGHRTRIQQEAPGRWHRGEDELLDGYLARSRDLDRLSVWLDTVVPHGWLVFGLAFLAPVFLFGAPSAGSLAVSLGGVLAAQQAIAKLSGGTASLSAFAIAWSRVRPLFRAAARQELLGAPGIDRATDLGEGELITARELSFRYPDRRAPVLDRCSFDVRRGDRVLLMGPSGGGKSTLAALLLGLREPNGGLLLLSGIDRPTWGSERWRRRIAAAPQFHENHVFSGTLAFNLLLGRGWPPTEEDLDEAEEVCRELGLGELLERMPAGLQEVVGETGWRLSHGERSRLFAARALLQGGELLVFDESFAALDPESLRSAIACARSRAPSLLVIAHP